MIRSTQTKTLSSVPIQDIKKVKEVIKARLPQLDAAEVRRHRIPYHEAAILEMHEEGLYEGAEFLTFLFDLDEETRRNAGPDTVVWNKPWLKDNKDLIDELRKVLSVFSQPKMTASDKTVAMIEMSLSIQKLSWEWWWIAETLYRSAFWIVKEIENDNQTITILRYLYARFLFNQMRNAKSALEYVRQAHEDSRDKPWSASKILRLKRETLFRDCCVLLHKVLLSIASDTRQNDPEVAINSCKVALSVANESGHEKLVAEAHYELGRSEVTVGNDKEAIKYFNKSLTIVERISDGQAICKALVELINVYKKISEHEKVLEHLHKFEATASEYQLPLRLAEAHYFTGEFNLSRDNPEEATRNFEFALSLYNKLGSKDEAHKTRCLIGVSKGQQLIRTYETLIGQSIMGDVDALIKICRWKDRGEPFLRTNEIADDSEKTK